MIMETIADLFKQFGCGPQVDMSGTNTYMAHIGGKGREPGVDILLVPVPCQQSMHCEAMSQIMDTWTGVFVVGGRTFQAVVGRCDKQCCDTKDEFAG